MHEIVYPDVERLRTADEALAMTEETFRALYERTARPLWAYLARATGSPQLADDLLQEAYFRFIRSRTVHESEAHQRHYLFRIALNLVRDERRRRRPDCVPLTDGAGDRIADPAAADAERSAAVVQALGRLTPRDRDLLWFAYSLGSSHAQIADTLGLRTSSVKQLLFRARRRLAALLGSGNDGSHQS
jgi:RNA polymerase sigma-70 factor (ECF subfamily)